MTQSPLLLFALIILVLALLESLWSVYRQAQLMRRTPYVVLDDVSDRALKPPPLAQEMVDAFYERNLRRVGEAEVAQFRTSTIWYTVDSSGTTIASTFVVGEHGVATIYNWFADSAVVVTVFPSNETPIITPNYHYVPVTTSLDDAFKLHRDHVTEFKLRFGNPQKLDSMAEIIRLDAIFNGRFASQRQRPRLIWLVIRTCVITVLFVLVMRLVALAYLGQPF